MILQNAHTHTFTQKTPVCTTCTWDSPFLSLFPLVYNQQLSASQIHKQSFVLLHQFFQVSEKEKKKNRSSGRDFVLLSAEQTARRQWRPSRVCGRNSSQVLMIA